MKKIIILLLILALIAVAGACTIDTAVSESTDDQAMITVTDFVGREVAIPDTVDRVAALYSPTGHITVMLGHGESIVATSNGILRDKLLHEICPAVKDAVPVKISTDFNIEELVALGVDVVFIPYDMYTDHNTKTVLDEFDLPYLVTDFNSIEDHQELILLLGEVFDEQEEAEAFCEYYDQIIAMTNSMLAELPEEDRIRVYHSMNEAVNTVAEDTLPHQWMEIAKGINVSLDGDLMLDGDKYYATLEDILAWNPQVILSNVEETTQYIMTQPAWENIEAVKNGRVYQMPVGVSRWGHKTSIETPLAIVWTAKTLYPEYCQQIDIEASIKEFYLEFFETELDDQQVNDILSGQGMRLTKALE